MRAKRRPLDACGRAEEKSVREEHALRMRVSRYAYRKHPRTSASLKCVLEYVCGIVSIL